MMFEILFGIGILLMGIGILLGALEDIRATMREEEFSMIVIVPRPGYFWMWLHQLFHKRAKIKPGGNP